LKSNEKFLLLLSVVFLLRNFTPLIILFAIIIKKNEKKLFFKAEIKDTSAETEYYQVAG